MSNTSINIPRWLRDNIRRCKIKAGYEFYVDIVAQMAAMYELILDAAIDGGSVVIRDKDGKERELLMAVSRTEADPAVSTIRPNTIPRDHEYDSGLYWFIPRGTHSRCAPALTWERTGTKMACATVYDNRTPPS